VVAGDFAGGVGVDITADIFDFFGDLLGVAGGRAFEQHMFDHVGDAIFGRIFVAGSDIDPCADGNAFDTVDGVANDPQAGGEGCEADVICHGR